MTTTLKNELDYNDNFYTGIYYFYISKYSHARQFFFKALNDIPSSNSNHSVCLSYLALSGVFIDYHNGVVKHRSNSINHSLLVEPETQINLACAEFIKGNRKDALKALNKIDGFMLTRCFFEIESLYKLVGKRKKRSSIRAIGKILRKNKNEDAQCIEAFILETSKNRYQEKIQQFVQSNKNIPIVLDNLEQNKAALESKGFHSNSVTPHSEKSLINKTAYNPNFLMGIFYLWKGKYSTASKYFFTSIIETSHVEVNYSLYQSYLGLSNVFSKNRGGLNFCYQAAKTSKNQLEVLLNLSSAEFIAGHRRRAFDVINELEILKLSSANNHFIQSYLENVDCRKTNKKGKLYRQKLRNKLVGKVFRTKKVCQIKHFQHFIIENIKIRYEDSI